MHAETLRWLALALEDLRAHSPEDVPACEHAMACVREQGALLKAAKEAVEDLEDSGYDLVIHTLRAAIAAAEGQPRDTSGREGESAREGE